MNEDYNSKRLIKPEPSKESLYNELVTTFDYSIGKKDKGYDNKKNNQT